MGGTLRNSTARTKVTASPAPTRRSETARRFSLIAQAKPMSAMTPKADCKCCISPRIPQPPRHDTLNAEIRGLDHAAHPLRFRLADDRCRTARDADSQGDRRG